MKVLLVVVSFLVIFPPQLNADEKKKIRFEHTIKMFGLIDHLGASLFHIKRCHPQLLEKVKATQFSMLTELWPIFKKVDAKVMLDSALSRNENKHGSKTCPELKILATDSNEKARSVGKELLDLGQKHDSIQ